MTRVAASASGSRPESGAMMAPKLEPKFAVLVAGAEQGERLSDPVARAKVKSSLADLLVQARDIFEGAWREAPVLYGSSVDRSAELSILAGRNGEIDRIVYEIAQDKQFQLSIIDVVSEDIVNLSGQNLSKLRELFICSTSSDHNKFVLSEICNDTARAASDLLIVVWNGNVESKECLPIINMLKNSILNFHPAIWINLDGVVNYLRLDAIDGAILRAIRAGITEVQMLKNLFGPPKGNELQSFILMAVDPISANRTGLIADHEIDKLKAHFSTPEIRSKMLSYAGRLDAIFTAPFAGKAFVEAAKKNLTQPYYGAADNQIQIYSSSVRQPEQMRSAFNWFDVKSNISAGLHRDSIWLVYLFSALSVFCAIFGSLHLWPDYHGDFWPIFEISLISGILLIFYIAKIQKNHNSWVSRRFIAEQLRYLRAGMIFVSFQDPVTTSPYRLSLTGKGIHRITLQSMEQWILRRIFIAEGMPRLSQGGAPMVIGQPLPQIKMYLEHFIAEQMKYHAQKSKQCHQVGHAIHRATVVAFTLTALSAAAHLVVHFQWLLIFTAGLPSVAAALHGIATQNEFRRLELMSKAVADSLSEALSAIEHIRFDSDNGSAAWLGLRTIAHDAFAVMSSVNQDWRALIKERTETLPS